MTGRPGFEEGGDPACWLDQVCEACGALRENPRALACGRCGEPVPSGHGAVPYPLPAVGGASRTTPMVGSALGTPRADATAGPGAGPARRGDVLVFSATAGYRHASIPAGAAALAELAAAQGMSAHHTEDPADLRPERLAGCAAVVFLSPTGDVLDDPARAGLRAYVEAGGGFLGVHAAACAEEGWPYYGELLGARFDGHPPVQRARVTVTDRSHPATAHLPERWEWTDEWYDFRDGPAGAGVRVLASVDESTYAGGATGGPHPLVWCHEPGAGRSFYTALGHPADAYADPDFRRHLLGALSWCARVEG